MKVDDLVISKSKKGEITSNGYIIKNMFLNCDIPIASIGPDYAIPAGLLLFNNAITRECMPRTNVIKDEPITANMYDRLLELAQSDFVKGKQTRRKRKKRLNKTSKLKK